MQYITKKEEFEQLIKENNNVVIDFFATWCVPCQMMSEVLRDTEKEYEDVIEVFKVDIDENQETAIRYDVTSMPTLVFFKDGEEVERKIGYIEKEELVSIIEDLK